MKMVKLLSGVLLTSITCACSVNLNRQASSFECEKIVEVAEKQRCNRNVNEFNDFVKQNIKKEKQEEKKEQLNFKKKEDEVKPEENKVN